jgi:hypothetical protein
MQGADLIDAVTPTALKPIVQWDRNKKYHGGKIKPDDSFKEVVPSSNYYDSANPTSIAISKSLNEISGGTGTRAGVLSVSPNNIDGLIDWFGPFMGSIYDVVGGQEFDNFRLKKLVHLEPGDYKPRSVVYDIKNKSITKKLTEADYARYERYLKIAMKDGSITESDKEDFRDEMETNQERVYLSPADADIRVSAKRGHKRLNRRDVTEQDINDYTHILEDAYSKELITKDEYDYRDEFIKKAWDRLEKDN